MIVFAQASMSLCSSGWSSTTFEHSDTVLSAVLSVSESLSTCMATELEAHKEDAGAEKSAAAVCQLLATESDAHKEETDAEKSAPAVCKLRATESDAQKEETGAEKSAAAVCKLLAIEFDAHEEETDAEKSPTAVCKLLAESNAAESNQYGRRLAAGALSGPASRSRFKS